MPSTRKPLVVIGSANMDLLTRVQAFPRPGETMPGSALLQRPGGKGANQAIAAAQAGATVSFIGNIGTGAFGDALVANLENAGIDLSHLERSPKLPAGTALILLNETGENEIVVTRSSNELVGLAQIKRSKQLIQEAGMVLLQLEIPLASVQEAIKLAHAAKVPVVLNPAPCTKPLPGKLLKQIDRLTPNELELAALTGKQVKSMTDVAVAAQHLLSLGARNIIVTCGAKGACWVTHDRITWFPAPCVKVIDTVGAGDCFNGVFAAEICAKNIVNQAISLAISRASNLISRIRKPAR